MLALAKRLSLTLSLIALSLSIICSQPAQAKKVLVLSQKNTLIGNLKVYVADDLIKITETANSWTLLAKAPDWKVFFYNDSTRLMLIRPLDGFQGSYGFGITATNGPWFTELPIKPTKESSVIKGQKVCRYTFKTAGPVSIKQVKRHDILVGCNYSQNLLRADYWVLNNKMPKQAALLTKLYKVPNTGSIPIRLTDLDESGKWTVDLDTSEARWEDVKDTRFDPPKGYDTAKSEREISLGKNSDDQIKTIFDELNYPLQKIK